MKTDAISILKADHTVVRGLLRRLERTSERSAKVRERLLGEISRAFKLHEQIEEEFFYPAFHEATRRNNDDAMFFEALQEHRLADVVLSRLRKLEPSGVEFTGTAKVLKELIEHHAGEEEAKMFIRARRLMSKPQLLELGAAMRLHKERQQAPILDRLPLAQMPMAPPFI